MNDTVKVVVGTPIYRAGAYILDKFLSNQKQIQQNYPSSELILATVEDDFIEELEALLAFWELRGKVIPYKTVKPDYAQSKIWNVACGREAIRQYTLLQTEASYLLFLDADMTFDPNVINIMEREIQGYDAVNSGYPLRESGAGVWLPALGCSMLTRGTLERVRFRCLEFKNGEVIPEDSLLEMDLISLRSRIKRGYFLSICHHISENDARCITPQPLGLLERIIKLPFVRYALIRTSIIVRYDIPWHFRIPFYRFIGAIRSVALPGRGRKKTG